MTPCDIIAQSLSIENLIEIGYEIKALQNGELCLFSGLPIKEGVLAKNIISSNFTDHEHCKGLGSKWVSVSAALCMKETLKIQPYIDANIADSEKTEGDSENKTFSELRKYSYIANNNGIVIIRSANLFDVLFSDKQMPFVFCLGTLRASKSQKHLSFKSIVNYNSDNFIVTTECGNVLFEMQKAKEILPILQKWYTVTAKTKGSAQESTYFTKDEILHSCNDFKRIEQYGYIEYFSENAKIEPMRNSLFLELIVKSIRKT